MIIAFLKVWALTVRIWEKIPWPSCLKKKKKSLKFSNKIDLHETRRPSTSENTVLDANICYSTILAGSPAVSKSCAVKESILYISGYYKTVLIWYIQNISVSLIHEHSKKLIQAATLKNLRQSCLN